MNGAIIAAHEGQEIHSSLIDALVAQEVKRQNNAALEAALAEKKQAEDANELMRKAYVEFWQERIDDAAALYSRNPRPGKVTRALAGATGLVVYVVAGGWKRLIRALGM